MSADRGRIPFALIGVLLLVSSATIAATSQPRTAPSEPAVSKAMERATAEIQTALRDAVQDASHDAAREPVVDRANTTEGRVLNESGTFRDSLRIRIYLAARDELHRIDRRRKDVRVTATLPPVENASSLRAAKRRVHVERADENGTTLRVRVENVTVTASRDGRVLTERRTSFDIVVGTPVLALHDRVRAYQRQLDAGVTKPGLDQRLTAQLYALTWIRGYAQYGGAPVENVLNNRYVAIATNAGLLDVQRATIGRSDAEGRTTLARATTKAAGSELLSASGVDAPPVQNELDAPTKPPSNDVRALDPPEGTRRDDTMSIGVNGTADRAFLNLVDGGDLNRSIRSVYSADARLVVDADRPPVTQPPAPPRPGPNWTMVEDDTNYVTESNDSDVSPPATPADWHRFERYGSAVDVEQTRTRTWIRDDETRTTVTREAETFQISVAVVGRHATTELAPERGIETAHERGAGPLAGPNLADVPDRSIERLVTRRGGSDELVKRAATGTVDTSTVTIDANRPDGIYRWIYQDLMDLRERIRSVTVTVERGKVGTFETNPPAMLAERLRERRGALVDPPTTYDSTATKARIAARSAYIDSVLGHLDERAADRRERGGRLDGALEERGAGSLSELQAGMEASLEAPSERRLAIDGPAGPVRLRVDSAPSYLTRAEIGRDRIPALDGPGHPLVARNVNLFTVPYSDVSDTVVDGLVGSGERVRLSTAARTLRAANATLERRNAPRVRERRAELQSEVAAGNDYVRGQMRSTLADENVGESKADRRAIVRAGLERWKSTATRALATSNGSASRAVAVAAAERTSMTAIERDLLRLKLQRNTQTALRRPDAKVRREVVNRSRTATRDLATEITKEIAIRAANRGVEYAANESFDRVPSGLPLVPPFTAWYATTNVWHVTVRGEYARFGIRADRGRPTDPGAGTTYARDGTVVTLDVDGDGERERLGRATRVDFDVSTTIIVVVPPGKSGVGDRNGNADERSDGWPDPGPG